MDSFPRTASRGYYEMDKTAHLHTTSGSRPEKASAKLSQYHVAAFFLTIAPVTCNFADFSVATLLFISPAVDPRAGKRLRARDWGYAIGWHMPT